MSFTVGNDKRPGASHSSSIGVKGLVVLGVVSIGFILVAFTDLGGIFSSRDSGTLSGQFKAARERPADTLEALPDRSATSLTEVAGENPETLPEVDYVAKARGASPMGVLSSEPADAILTPVEARRTDLSVAADDLVGGAFASKDYFQSGVGVTHGSALQELLKDVTAPEAGKTFKVRPAPGGGKMSAAQVRELLTRTHEAYSRTKFNTGQGTPFSQLVYGRARATGQDEGASQETAAAAIDSVFDGRPFEEAGGKPNRSSPAVKGERSGTAGDFGNPATASMAQRLGLAQGLADDRKACEAADAQYDSLAGRLTEEMRSAGAGASAECKSWMKCEPAWPQTDEGCRTWSKGRILSDLQYRWCRCSMHKCGYIGACTKLNRMSCDRTQACPLTRGQACEGPDCGI